MHLLGAKLLQSAVHMVHASSSTKLLRLAQIEAPIKDVLTNQLWYKLGMLEVN